MRSPLVSGSRIQIFPSELETFVEVAPVGRVVVAAQHWIIPLEVCCLCDVQLGRSRGAVPRENDKHFCAAIEV